MSQMDTFFISHGSPTLSIDEKIPARHFLQSWKEKVLPGLVPNGIIVISAHWDTAEPAVNVISGKNETIHDFNGFPNHMYQLKYPAPGAPDLAKKVKLLLQKSGFSSIKEDKARGLDHGAWVPLMLMYPEANIPVCQLSLQTGRDGTYHYNMGKALSPLREEGVLIIGSGSATHNEKVIGPDVGALDFDTWLKESLLNGRHEELNRFEEKAPFAKIAHPCPDHFYPLNVALGAAGEKAKAELIHHSWGNTSVTHSYASYRFSTVQ